MEQRAKKRAKKQNIKKAVLTTIGAAGVIAMALAAPNTLQLLKYAPAMRSRYRSRAQRAIDRLIKQGYVQRTGNKKSQFELTSRGEALLTRLTLGEARYKPPERWDGKWRIVIFDIPEVRHLSRDHLRNFLQRIGFLMLQASVWVYPHDCEDLVMLLKTDYSLGKEVIYIIAEDIEGDWFLRKHFGLSE